MNEKSNIAPVAFNFNSAEVFNDNLISLFKLSGKDYFNELVRTLCANINSKYVFIGKCDSMNENIVVQSFYTNDTGTYIENFKYALRDTASQYIINNGLCVFFDKVQKEFPNDKGLSTHDIESFIGMPLFDLTKKPIGIIVVMDQKPIQDVKRCKQNLESIRSKSELEIERLSLKTALILSKRKGIDNFQNISDVNFNVNFTKSGRQTGQVISPNIEKVLGYSQKEVKKLNFIDFFNISEEGQAFLQLMNEKKSVENYLLKFKDKNNTIAYVEVDCLKLEIELAEELSFQLIGKFKDVSARIKGELRIKIAYLIAEKSQHRFIELNSFCGFIYQSIREIINVPNFYVASLRDGELFFPFYKDEVIPKEKNSFSSNSNSSGFVEFLVENKINKSFNKNEIRELITHHRLNFEGVIPEDLMCIKLETNGVFFGVMVVNNYCQFQHFTFEDIGLFKFIAIQLSAIIDRKKWQVKLVKSEAYFRSLVENSSEIISVITTTGVIEYISGITKKILGYTPQDLEGCNLSEFLGFIELNDFVIAGIPTNKKTISKVVKIVSQNGQNKYLDVLISKSNDDQSNIVLNAKDVTQRVETEKTKKSEQESLFVIHKIKKALISYESLDYILNDVLKIIEESEIGFDKLNVSLVNHSEKTINVLALRSQFSEKVKIGNVIPFSELPELRSLINKKDYSIINLSKKKVLNEYDEKNIIDGIQSYLIMPIIANNKVIAILNMASKYKEFFNTTDIALFKEITRLLAVVINEFLLKERLSNRESELVMILNSSNEGILKVGILDDIFAVNDRLCEILGYTEKTLLNKKSINFVDEKDVKKYKNVKKEILRNKIEKIAIDIKFRVKEDRVIDSKVTLRSIFDIKGSLKYVIMFIEDKTEEREALKKVLDLENALNYSCSVLFTDNNSIITDANEKAIEYTGYTREYLVGKSLKFLNLQEYIEADWKALWKTISSGKVWQGELRNKRKDGSWFWQFTNAIPILNKHQELDKVAIIGFDITEDVNEKNALIKEVIEAQDHERERFSMEIHDGLGQMLLASKMNLTAISDLDGLDDEMKKVLDTSVDLLVGSIQEARSISHGLMSRVLGKFGLAYAIDEIICNINISPQINFSFSHNIKDVRFNEDIEMGVYRTLQELVKNVIRHSNATKASIEIIQKKQELFIEIRDNGIGIKNKLTCTSESGGIGLRNMKSRVSYLGGRFDLDNTVKKGTKINIRISL